MTLASFTRIDTNAVPWEHNPGIPGFKRRLLVFDDATRSEIRMDAVGVHYETNVPPKPRLKRR